MDREKTPQERAAFDCFLKKLDSRHFLIMPQGVKFKGSAMGAKHRAMELLEGMEVGESVRVVEGFDTTVWYQEKRPQLDTALV
jgi:hypothetical protein